jgi:hypothetical protein
MGVPLCRCTPRLPERGTARGRRVCRLVPHALLRLLQPEDRLALGEGDPHPRLDGVWLFACERENVAQEGFDALTYRVSPPYRLSA